MEILSNYPAGASSDRSAPFNRPDDSRPYCTRCGDVTFQDESDGYENNVWGLVCEKCDQQMRAQKVVSANADLRGVYLRGANLRGVYLRGAHLRDADLGYANLANANINGANFRDANVEGVNLRDAHLAPIREDFWAVLSAAPNEVAGLCDAIRKGLVDGSTYKGECTCLVGTLARVQGCRYDAIPGLPPNQDRLAERFVLAIKPGDTPATSQFSALALEWAEEWLVAYGHCSARGEVG